MRLSTVSWNVLMVTRWSCFSPNHHHMRALEVHYNSLFVMAAVEISMYTTFKMGSITVKNAKMTTAKHVGLKGKSYFKQVSVIKVTSKRLCSWGLPIIMEESFVINVKVSSTCLKAIAIVLCARKITVSTVQLKDNLKYQPIIFRFRDNHHWREITLRNYVLKAIC